MSRNKEWRMLFASIARQMKKVSHSQVRAFSIVEVMLASAILAIGLTAILQLLSSSLKSSFDNADAIVAIELAQEGIEYAYNVRDNNLVNGRPAFPTSGDYKFPGTTKRDFCAPNNTSPKFILTGGNKNCFANAKQSEQRYSLDQAGGFYDFQNGVTHFARVVSVNLDNISDPKSAEITSVVWWGGSDTRPSGVFTGVDADDVDISKCTRAKRCAYVRTILTNWK